MLRTFLLIFYVNVAVLSTAQLSGQISYDLPLVIIETGSFAPIPDDPKVTATLKIINNPNGVNHIDDEATDYDGFIGIERRGNYSAFLPQKPYSFETREEDGSNRNVSLLGMPEENDWILLANYNDKVFMRNTLSYHLFREMGHYAPRTRYCEVFLNGIYQGIYLLAEKIKIDKNRVDIATVTAEDTEGDEATGGYIFKNDYFEWDGSDNWIGNFSPERLPDKTVRFVYYDPKKRELKEEQRKYLEDFVDGFETALFGESFTDETNGFRAFIDQESFIDYLLISELSRNVDAYKKSKYYFKDKDSKGGKLVSGPVWDYDWAYKNVDGAYKDGSQWAHISYDYMYPTPNGWIERMLKDSRFRGDVVKRYRALRETILSESYLFEFIDGEYEKLSAASERHYAKWPTLGSNVGTPEGDDIQPTTYEGEIKKFKDWLSVRLAWLDNNMWKDEDISDGDDDVEEEVFIRLFPNPSSGNFYVESNLSIHSIQIVHASGAQLLSTGQLPLDTYSHHVSIDNAPAGVYFVISELSDGIIKISRLSKVNHLD